MALTGLPGRTTNPATDATYNAIFPLGEHWLHCRAAGRVRVEKTLPANDAARRALVPVVTQGLKDFEKATHAAGLGLSGYQSARTAWQRHRGRLYSALRADHGADYAERFFPRTIAKGKKTATSAGETPLRG